MSGEMVWLVLGVSVGLGVYGLAFGWAMWSVAKDNKWLAELYRRQKNEYQDRVRELARSSAEVS